MNFPIFGRIRPVVFLVVGMVALLGGGAALALPVVEPVQALPLSPSESRMKLLEVGNAFYGTSQSGGSYNLGTAFKLAPNGIVTILANFNGANGSTPRCGMILGPDGALYGTTENGGASDLGTVFRITTEGNLSTLVSFGGGNGSRPRAGLVLGADGNFYGTTWSGGVSGISNYGTCFRLSTSGVLTSLASFDGENGYAPVGRLLQSANGDFFGVCQGGGETGNGTVFKVTTNGVITRLASFNRTNGQEPMGGLIADADGNFLGVTWGGGSSSKGTVFRMTPEGSLSTLVHFNGVNGAAPSGELTAASDGNFYGTTYSEGSDYTTGSGTVFRVTSAGVFTKLVSFTSDNGAGPAGGLVASSDGYLYGVTSAGGISGVRSGSLNGVVFRMNLSGGMTILSMFSDFAGKWPRAGLVVGGDGNFYGTASGGGGIDGAIFRMTPTGVLSAVHNFGIGANTTGASPMAPLTLGTGSSSGSMFGTASGGGANVGGTVFKLSAAGVVTPIQSFSAPGPVGYTPLGPVINQGAKTYGLTSAGGSGGKGAFVRMESGTVTALASFSDSTGNTPLGGPTWVGGSTFYASTSKGGTGGKGTIFKINGDSGAMETLVNFDSSNGDTPVGELLLVGDAVTGTFYGTTQKGGSRDFGTVFKMTPAGVLTTLASFGGTNGNGPRAGLALGPDGNFYGTTEKGGARDLGTVFRMTPDGALKTLLSFDGPNGSNPCGLLVAGPNGSLYGTTAYGGLSPDGKYGGGGQIFRIAFDTLVATRQAASLSPNSAVLRGRVNPVAGVTTAFEFGTDPNLGSFTTLGTRAIPAGDEEVGMELPIVGLAPLTTYYFRAVGVPAGNPAAIKGTILSFTTPAPGDLAVDGPDAGELSSGGTVMFGNTAIGQNRDVVITLRNALAGSMLTDLSASLTESGGPFSITTTPAATLSNGETTTLTLRFHPTTNGGRTATLSIASNDPDENPFTLTLRGWGGEVFSPVIDPAGGTPVSWSGFTATGVTLSGTTFNGTPARGVDYVILDNPGAGVVGGIFTGLPEGAAVTLTYGGNSYRFYISYTGGDGNDIVLRYWPETDIDPEEGPEEFLFAALDGDRDDRLTLAEWQNIHAKIPSKETIFPLIDSNRDTFLTFGEFTAGASNRSASRIIGAAVQRTSVFLKVETSYDNIVTRAEIGFMWKPGTSAGTIDSFWSRANGGSGLDFWEWLRAKSLPSFTTFEDARKLRAERLVIALQLDADDNEVITRNEFARLYPSSAKAATIDSAWRTANATARGLPSPESMTVTQFVEAAKLPKLVVY